MHQLLLRERAITLYLMVLGRGIANEKTQKIAVHAGRSRQLTTPREISPQTLVLAQMAVSSAFQGH